MTHALTLRLQAFADLFGRYRHRYRSSGGLTLRKARHSSRS
jgi:hypothetical protein